jgi:CDP-diacylglycerol--glycerol-3-phosphate 3-phosphatidyltransferase (EC 2.7.8.5)
VNLPNKLTVLRICMIPIFILVVGLPLDWGQFNVGDTTLAVTQLVGAVYFCFS